MASSGDQPAGGQPLPRVASATCEAPSRMPATPSCLRRPGRAPTPTTTAPWPARAGAASAPRHGDRRELLLTRRAATRRAWSGRAPDARSTALLLGSCATRADRSAGACAGLRHRPPGLIGDALAVRRHRPRRPRRAARALGYDGAEDRRRPGPRGSASAHLDGPRGGRDPALCSGADRPRGVAGRLWPMPSVPPGAARVAVLVTAQRADRRARAARWPRRSLIVTRTPRSAAQSCPGLGARSSGARVAGGEFGDDPTPLCRCLRGRKAYAGNRPDHPRLGRRAAGSCWAGWRATGAWPMPASAGRSPR